MRVLTLRKWWRMRPLTLTVNMSRGRNEKKLWGVMRISNTMSGGKNTELLWAPLILDHNPIASKYIAHLFFSYLSFLHVIFLLGLQLRWREETDKILLLRLHISLFYFTLSWVKKNNTWSLPWRMSSFPVEDKFPLTWFWEQVPYSVSMASIPLRHCLSFSRPCRLN